MKYKGAKETATDKFNSINSTLARPMDKNFHFKNWAK